MTVERSGIVLDIETTGLSSGNRQNEITQLAIIDLGGRILFHRHFLVPEVHETTSILDTLQPFEYYQNEIQDIINAASLIIAYNFAFDYAFLCEAGISFNKKSYYCAMRGFAPVYGKRNAEGDGWRWQTLSVCAEYFGYSPFETHDALEDAKATLYCFQKMLEIKQNARGDLR